MTEIKYKPEVTFKGKKGETTILAKADTGAKRTTIDFKTAAKIGAGPVVSSVKINGSERRPIAKVEVQLKHFNETVEVGLADREGRSTDAILGRDILQDFKVNVQKS